MRVRRYEPKWYGFALSRAPLAAAGDVVPRRVARRGLLALRARGRGAAGVVARVGRRACSARERARIELSDVAGGRYRGANVDGERLQACVFVATAKSLPSRNWLATLFGSQTLSDADRLAILAGRAPKGSLEAGPVVCSCFAVGRSTLLRAIRGDKLVSVEQIGKALQRGHELRLVHSGAQGVARRVVRLPPRRPG